jgi:DNA-binding response OmpR family regulator
VKLLIAEDDVFFRRLLQQVLGRDYELVSADDGLQAWTALRELEGPRLAVLDWVMPGLSGPQVCRQVRQLPEGNAFYLLILTARNSAADVVSGLRAGADDYVTKPFDPEELRARVRVGERILEMQDRLQAHASALAEAKEREQQLVRLLPVCPACRRVRADSGYWLEVDRYLDQLGSGQSASCPACAVQHHAAMVGA